ncbi:MAG: hypothetical protein GY811_15525 [Myxococcales bacterium]|nr:hypothetical protein [Myxococcales bacterium]
MNKTKPLKQNRASSQRGASFIEVLCMIALLGLATGGAMYAIGETLLDTAKSDDETMNASSLSHGESTSSSPFSF